MRRLLFTVWLLAVSVFSTHATSTNSNKASCQYFPLQLNHVSLIVSNLWIGTEFDTNSQSLHLEKTQVANAIAMNYSTRLTEKVVAVLPFSIRTENSPGPLLSAQDNSISHPSITINKAS